MRHKYLTADRHPNASPSSSRCTWYFPRGRGSWWWISFFNHSPPPKTLPRHLCAPRVRRFGPSIRHANTNSAERVRPKWIPRIHYIYTLYTFYAAWGEREREREGSSLQNSSNRGPFSSESSLSFNERPNRESLVSLVNRGNNIPRQHRLMIRTCDA